MNTSTSSFLALPPELRDLIYQFAVEETLPWPESFTERYSNILKQHTANSSQETSSIGSTVLLLIHYPSRPPRPTWLSLLQCSRTIHSEIKHLFPLTNLKPSSQPVQTPPDHDTAHILLNLTSTTLTCSWLTLRCRPQHLRTLHIKIHLSDLGHADLTSGRASCGNRIIHAIYILLRQFFTFGPHFSGKVGSSSAPLRLKTVLISLAAAPVNQGKADGQVESYFFGDYPEQQMATITGVLTIWLHRLRGSGLLWCLVDEFRLDCEALVEELKGNDENSVFPVEDRSTGYEVFRSTFERLGYRWDQ
ncbi:hypothetical protein CERZMDRAFT_98186 [Cercospora zeae-maydis SCOH1-5]|uniref:F-box domain-containing protein n=1 Tax=Cercospora zeae-maydis SCOH1-5 TaxID=717836 RepID=A0A6A6FEG9_9PEZI|nr:hypothetical protein CERZMDRAFT_98186 [Cercospora zeae-maydis SCOH1-5]